VCNHKRFIKIEIHIAGAELSASAGDKNIINDDPSVLRNQRAVNKNFVAR
jgi:hypothetical protein